MTRAYRWLTSMKYTIFSDHTRPKEHLELQAGSRSRAAV